MLPRLPPLNAVRAFAAAARHLSFTRAALELHVTHSAISRQIQALEAHLGVALFERKTRQVLLTAAGHQFHAQIGPALEQIGSAAESLRGSAPPRTVKINVRPTFAVRWLIPRLPGFVALHPDIEPQVMTSTLPPDKAQDAFDLAIRRGTRGWPAAMQIHPCLEDEALVVGSPALFARCPVNGPASLASHVLLLSRSRSNDWEHWKQRANVPGLKPAGCLQFEHLHFVLQAAVDGLGFALAPTSLIAHDVASGRLVCPLPDVRMALSSHCVGVAPNASPQTQRFVQWLLEEMKTKTPSG
ncbi:LysR family transcriptional regulator [Hydrogenophaga taeniospiralis]|uniref:LysR substrate-binding domain-containing protein n=1 Tax=Hydrogenophaga taeniospiralis TaxID=65656 RepID=UPI001CFA1840|nr:LysR substrate-binding domain-containing protein [Hydrogenophaga taeniospiralis]MCB4362961.1 LysR family transcriptional regulator [Hydrogenophaga taeniospiralis]